MRQTLIASLLLLTVGTAYAGPAWIISAKQPCIGLTAGFARPMPDVSDLVGPQWHPAPGPASGQGLVLIFVASCPASTYAGQATGAFTAAFVLVPVLQLGPAGNLTHSIAVLRAAGEAGTPVMRLFHVHGIPINDTRVSLTANKSGKQQQVHVRLETNQGTLTLRAELQPPAATYKSLDTIAVRVTPAAGLFSGFESSTRYAKGTAEAHSTGTTWLERYQLGKPLFVTLDRHFVWNFTFANTPTK
ncbi:MAG: hypothetical protein ACRETQ_03920 [Gammaproteobacteria bacterium]